MTSQWVERTWIRMGGYGRFRGEWVNKLQIVQNSAARLLTSTKKHEHISPILRSLLWLPIPERIDFKLLLLTFKSLMMYRPTRTMRSVDKGHLVQADYNLKTYGYRAFSHVAPKIWNSMPVSLHTCCELSAFKSKIKTFLFKHTFQL